MSDWDPRINEIFAKAVALRAEERGAYLDRECGGDQKARAAVESLLEAHQSAEGFLSKPHPAAGPLGATAAYATPRPQGEVVGTVVGGRYKLLERIGEGGMGTVWMADQLHPVRRRVAVKLIRPEREGAGPILARFDAERQAIAVMDHPNIAKLLDAGETDDGRPYFVMELVKGVPLTNFCDERRMAVRERLELFVQVCSAIQHAHQKGIIHRDLKPSNILVELHEDRPVPKVIDFGLAKATGGRPLTDRTLFTAFGTVAGTPLYMAPEQARLDALDVDTRADVYALGVILYELLTGGTPIERAALKQAALDELLRMIRETEPPAPSKRLSSSENMPSVAASRHSEPAKLTKLVRGELDWIVMKALEKDRNRRYETANGFAMDVQRYLADEPVQACPPSTVYRIKKFVRRNKATVIAASLVLLSLMGGIVGTTYGLFQADKQRREAQNSATAERQAKLDALRAAEAEKTAKEETQRRLAQIEKGVEMFAGLLRGLNPNSEEQDAPPLYEQLRERAAKAADEMVGETVAEPEAVARLQTLLGSTLLELGHPQKAMEVLERARATREAKLGADHADTLVTLDLLASACRDAGKVTKAIALLQQVRDAHLKTFGPDHPETLTTLDNVARAYFAAGKLPEAIALFEKVRDARVKKLGPDHEDTFTTQNNLAAAYVQARKLPQAIALLEQVRFAYVKNLGPAHNRTLNVLNNLAVAYQDAGKLSEAIALFEQVRDAQKTKLGATHARTLATLNNLAFAYQNHGKLPEAIAVFEQLRGAFMKTFGPDHPNTLVLLNNLARAYKDAGKLPEAIALFEQAAVGVEKRRFEHQYAGRIIDNMIDACAKAKQFDKAELWRRKWLVVVKERAGADSIDYSVELAALGPILLNQKKWSEAETSLKECLTLREKHQPNLWSTFNTKSTLGEALMEQKKYAQAEPLLLAGFEGLKKRESQLPPEVKGRVLHAAMERLMKLHDAQGNKDKAAEWRKQLESHKERERTGKPMDK